MPTELITYPNVGHNFVRQGTSDVAAQRAAMEKLMSFLSATFPAVPLGIKVAQRGSQDMNGDGFSDILWRNSANVTRYTDMAGGVPGVITNPTSPGATYTLIAPTGGG